MSRSVIVTESLGKLYRVGQRERSRTLRDVVGGAVTSSLRRTSRLVRPGAGRVPQPSKADYPTLWALRHVSFALQQGEVLGVIGRDGSGKSTLLKILSRITEPTSGLARIQG